MLTKSDPLVDALYHVPGKAEIVDGRIVLMSPTGYVPGRAAFRILMSLGAYEEERNGGRALGDNVGFIVNLPKRRSFSPDAAWYTGDADSAGMKFLQGAPAFAAEVRSENDYGARAERAIAAKIRDYFAAGTQVVWDVDPQGDGVVCVYRRSEPGRATVYHRGDVAEAEPAVPGWRLPVDRLFS